MSPLGWWSSEPPPDVCGAGDAGTGAVFEGGGGGGCEDGGGGGGGVWVGRWWCFGRCGFGLTDGFSDGATAWRSVWINGLAGSLNSLWVMAKAAIDSPSARAKPARPNPTQSSPFLMGAG